MSTTKTPDDIRDTVREGYARIAEQGATIPVLQTASSGGCCGGACGGDNDALATGIGYDEAELALLPEGANMGLSCGNPTALASLREGEVVLDLGSGGGFDAFLAGRRVGATGRVIGVDMTPQMLAKARRNVETYRARGGVDNVEFRLGEIEFLPVADASVDVVLSNCVLNLSPDKPQVWREIFRVLKPGGRVAISDLAQLQPLPPGVHDSVDALIGCFAGAVEVEATRRMMQDAGFTDIVLTPKPEYMRTLAATDDGLYAQLAAALPAGTTPDAVITSLDIAGRRPAATTAAT